APSVTERCAAAWRTCAAAVVLLVSAARVEAQPLDVDASGPPVDAFTDMVYVARRLFMLTPVPPSFRALDPGIPPDAEIAARIDATGPGLDGDADRSVDAFTDVVYCSRVLFSLTPVPPSFRVLDPNIPSDMDIAARCALLTSEATATATPSATSLPSAT